MQARRSHLHASEDDQAAPLGGLGVSAFLRRHWHKRAMLARAAMPGFNGLFDLAALRRLAARDDVESRLVFRDGARWRVEHGPFGRAAWRALPPRAWTLLVQGVNLHDATADALLRRFAFIPYARLDDLMVSYAAPGGGVGPHIDSYDVFLLQGFGRRRWRYGRQRDLALRPGLPLKILKRFEPDHQVTLRPGDMLYLPPHYAHDGTAIDACTTYSIGFRAAAASELATAFLDFLRDRVDLPGRYADPDLTPTRQPARIGPAMRRRCAGMIAGVRWNDATIAEFVGCSLSEPKPHVYFTPPKPPLSRTAFSRALASHGVALNLRTQLLYDSHNLYVNGTARPWPASDASTLRRLADRRSLGSREGASLSAASVALLYTWYRDGYVESTAR